VLLPIHRGDARLAARQGETRPGQAIVVAICLPRHLGTRPGLQSRVHSARNLPTTASRSCSTRWNNVPRIEILVRLDGDGGAPQRTRASVGPYCVAGARTPRALYRSMAADGLVPRHDHGRRGRAVGESRLWPARLQR
jgi:hypothetical protein